MMRFKSLFVVLVLSAFYCPPLHGATDTAWDMSQANTARWKCKYCPSEKQTEYTFGINAGYLDDDVFRFGHLSGIDKGLNLFPTFSISSIDPEGYLYNTSLTAQSIDAKQFDFNWMHPGQWQVTVRYQDFPTRQYDNLYSPYSLQSNSQLTLPANWAALTTAQGLMPDPQYQSLDLAQDWQRFDLGLALKSDDITYKIDYQRTEKSGTQASSTAQMVNAFYLPLPVNETTETLDFGLSGQYSLLRYTVGYSVSRFSNDYQGIAYDVPYQPLQSATQGQTALAPDNVAYKIRANVSAIMPSSTVKLYFAVGEHKQDEALLPYSINPEFNLTLPIQAPALKVATRHFNVRYKGKLSSNWTVSGKYNYRNRDNQSPQWQFTPVINEVFIGPQVVNIPYDFTRRKLTLMTKWRFDGDKSVSLHWQENKKRRDFEVQSTTRDEGFTAKLNLPFDNNSQLSLVGEQLNRTARQWQVIDLIETNINPLLQKFTHADREHNRYEFTYALPFDSFSVHLTGNVLSNDYLNSVMGLQRSDSKQSNLTFDWRINPTMMLSSFFDWQRIETTMNASHSLIAGQWSAQSEDKLSSYGINLGAKQLFERPITLELKWLKSRGDSAMHVTSQLRDEILPDVTSQWSSFIVDLSYWFENHWTFQFSYQYEKFSSADYALDNAVPGAVRNLLTFGALSHNYRVNYFLLSVTYQF